MKHIKHIMLLFILLFLIAGIPTYSSTADAAKKSKEKVTYKLKNGTLTISGKGKMPETMTFAGNKKVKTVVIKKGVTSICDDAFMNCNNLTNVTISSSVKSIGCQSFYRTGLTSLEIPSGVKTIGRYAFAKCGDLKTLTIPGTFKYIRDKRKSYGQVSGLINNTELDTVIFNTALDIEKVHFFPAGNLLVREDDPAYKSINGIIYSRDGKSIICVPALRKELVVEEGCTEFCVSAVSYCEGLEKITMPTSVKTVKTEKTDVSDRNKKKIDFVIQTRQLDNKSISALYRWFDIGVGALQQKLPEQLKYDGNMLTTLDGYLIAYDGEETDVKVPDGIKLIGEEAFYNNREIEKVELPESVTGIGANAFRDCRELKTIHLPEGLTKIEDRAFSYCLELKSIYLPKSLIHIGAKAFEKTSMKQVQLPAGLKYLGKGAFTSAEVTEINIPSGITIIQADTFLGTNLKKIVIPDSVTKIGRGAFAYCDKLKKVTFGSGVKEIGREAFYDTCSLLNIKIPATVKKIGKYAFGLEEYSLKKKLQRTITIMGSSKNISSRAFDTDDEKNTVLIYKKGPEEYKTEFTSWYSDKTADGKHKLSLKWVKVNGASGYQIAVYRYKDYRKKKFNKPIKTFTVNKNQTYLKSSMAAKQGWIGLRIRPYKKVKGKKIYGRWSTGTFFGL